MTVSGETQTNVAALWPAMDRQARLSLASLKEHEIPIDPGVYALYRGGEGCTLARLAACETACGRTTVAAAQS
jgi:hypothetical protein